MKPEERLNKDEDWIAGKRFGHSLRKLLERYPEGAPDRVFAAALVVREEHVDSIFQRVMEKFKKAARSL
jgi:hypothetical protein